MASLRQVRDRIKSVKNIRQITRAMKMVASSRLRKAQTQLLETRPYAQKMSEVIAEIVDHLPEVSHPLLKTNVTETEGVVVLTSDKGLCAGFNVQVLQKAARHIEQAPTKQAVEVVSVGRKSLDFFRRSGIKPYKEWAGFWQDLNWYHADTIAQELIEAYSAGRWSRLTIIYNRFKSAISQEPVEQVLLPLPKIIASTQKKKYCFGEFVFEPSADKIMPYLLPRYVKVTIWRALLESKAAEMAARMQAMENATQSAGDMISDLTLQMNRARQAQITREISELVGSAEAINA